LRRYAGEVGLDLASFERDRIGDAALDRVRRDVESGIASGEVRATPTLFIDGVVHDGGYDAATLLEALGGWRGGGPPAPPRDPRADPADRARRPGSAQRGLPQRQPRVDLPALPRPAAAALAQPARLPDRDRPRPPRGTDRGRSGQRPELRHRPLHPQRRA